MEYPYPLQVPRIRKKKERDEIIITINVISDIIKRLKKTEMKSIR